jgi:hypothetical protein
MIPTSFARGRAVGGRRWAGKRQRCSRSASPALRTALERAADAEQTTPSDIVRRALRDYLVNASKHTGGASG